MTGRAAFIVAILLLAWFLATMDGLMQLWEYVSILMLCGAGAAFFYSSLEESAAK